MPKTLLSKRAACLSLAALPFGRTLQNSKGTVYYGMHFYPGVAEYAEPGKDAFRVFLNEDTIRTMDPTFAGRPVYVMHVDGVPDKVDELNGETDGWVVESFYNEADGKHWVKFLICSERGEGAIRRGMRLSNAYQPKSTRNGGLWNGVSYEKEITSGEYEHLAIVPNPRYEESVILTPEEFKVYNAEKLAELKRLSNERKDAPVILKLFNRSKVENAAIKLDETFIELPKSKREVSIVQLVNESEKAWEEAAKPAGEQMANGEHMVEYGGERMKLNDFMKKHDALCQQLASMKNDPDDFTTAQEPQPAAATNAEDEEEKKKALQIAEHEEKEVEEAKKKNAADAVALEARKKKAAEAAAKLKNAGPTNAPEPLPAIEFSADRVQRGKAKYGS